MLRLRDIMTTDVRTLSPETTLRDAVAMLAANHVSGAPVVAGGKVVGVVSSSDLLDFEASTLPVPGEAPESVAWGELEAEVEDEADAQGSPAGTYFTDLWTDDGAELPERFATTESPEWDLLGDHTVSEVMSRLVHRMSPDARVDAAADAMRRTGIHRVLVMEGDALRGVVTTMDVTKAVADHQLVVRRWVFDRQSATAPPARLAGAKVPPPAPEGDTPFTRIPAEPVPAEVGDEWAQVRIDEVSVVRATEHVGGQVVVHACIHLGTILPADACVEVHCETEDGGEAPNAHGMARMWSALTFHNGVYSFEAHLAQRQLDGAERLSVSVRPLRGASGELTTPAAAVARVVVPVPQPEAETAQQPAPRS